MDFVMRNDRVVLVHNTCCGVKRVLAVVLAACCLLLPGCSDRNPPKSDIAIRGSLQELARVLYLYDNIDPTAHTIDELWERKSVEARSIEGFDRVLAECVLLYSDVPPDSDEEVVLVAAPHEAPGYIYTVKPTGEVLYEYCVYDCWSDYFGERTRTLE